MRKKTLILMSLFVVLALALAACGGGGSDTSGNTDVDAGKELFAESIIGSQAGCSTCHSLDADTVIVGPSIAGIASRAGTQVSGMSAEDYLRQSILEPDAFVTDGFDAGLMVQVWAQELSDEQVDQLVAYLMTLE